MPSAVMLFAAAYALCMPCCASHQDLYNHILWKNKIETEASLEAAKDILPDMSDYYAKFGMGGGGGTRLARGGLKGRAMPARQ
eukprot:361839-Chlamydomonas_euryale.AAC.12